MVVTRSQAGNDDRPTTGRVFSNPPRSPSTETSSQHRRPSESPARTSAPDLAGTSTQLQRTNPPARTSAPDLAGTSTQLQRTNPPARTSAPDLAGTSTQLQRTNPPARTSAPDLAGTSTQLQRTSAPDLAGTSTQLQRTSAPDLAGTSTQLQKTNPPARTSATDLAGTSTRRKKAHSPARTNTSDPAGTSTQRKKANSIRSHRSTASVVARMRYEAEEKLAAIRRKELQLEAELIKKKLATDMAALEDDSNAEDESPEQVEQRVTTWLDDNDPGMEAIRGESSDPYPLPTTTVASELKPTNTQLKKGRPTRVEWDTPPRERSPTPARSRSRGVEQLADVLEKMMTRRPPPRQASELPVFSGALTEWLPFKAAMEETTAIYNFTPIENLARLRNCLRGEAKETVSPLLSAASSPDQVMKTLEQCFGRPEVMVDRIIEDLKKLPRLGGTSTELNTFAVKVQNAVAVLKKLKHGYLFNPMLTRDILEKLSPHQRTRWYDYAEEASKSSSDPEIIILSDFLMREADRALKHGFCANATTKREVPRPPARTHEFRNKKPIFTVSTEVDVEKSISEESHMKCVACGQEHALPKCTKFLNQSIQERWDTVKNAKLCFKCIYRKHRRMNCREKNCGTNGCKRPHHPLLHEEKAVLLATTTPETVASVTHGREVKLKMRPITAIGPKGKMKILALFDEGSTVTLLDSEVARAIGADGPSKALCMHGINADRREMNSQLVKINICGHDGIEHNITARTINGMNLLSQTVPEKLLLLEHLKDLKQEELCYEDGKPQLLIGTDNWQLIVTRELRIGKRNQPAASKTQLGWVIHGSIPKKIVKQDYENVLHIATVETRNDQLEEIVKKHFDIDALGISTKPMIKEEEQRAIDIFEKTVNRRKDGHYEVGLPWRTDDVKLPMSYNNALRRLKNLEHKLNKSPSDKQQYEEQVQNLLRKGYAEKCDGSEAGSNVTWYLPHFPVKNPNKPGKVRLVFDAAARTHGVCLNDFLLEGPDLLVSLLTILFRFREEAVAIKADVQEMFLQVKIRKQDQPAQMFLWRGDRDESPTAYKMTAMIFGASSSPFLAHCVRNRNAQDFAESHPGALRAITEAHYMDDYVDSYPNKEVTEEVISQVDYVHHNAGFQLRGWTSNEVDVLRKIPTDRHAKTTTQSITKDEQKTLGMLWDSVNDVLKFNTSLNRVHKEVREMTRTPTKREALSAVMSIYDPLGLLSCYTITAKIILQDLWRQKLGWDETIPTEPAETFAQWLKNLEIISHLELPRSYNGGSPVKSRQLHVFCDASKEAYAAAAYWRLEQDHEVRVVLAAAKAKVAPLKSQTIPRMELQAALIGARLGNHVAKEHRWNPDAVFFWTDAQVVLHWIQNGSRRYTPYVSHRLGEIAELTSIHQWKWTPTKSNVADLATRPGYIPKTADDPWFHGPEFLSRPMNEWPQNDSVYEDQEEEHAVLATMDSARELDCLPEVKRFSSYERLIRATAMLYLFAEKCKNRKATLNVEHLKKAEALWHRKAQKDSFKSEIELMHQGKRVPRSSSLHRLNPIYRDGLLLLDGRIGAAHVPAEMKNPVLLDGRHPFTKLLVTNEHKKAGHGSRERVVNDLRQKYWILKLRPTVRSVTKDCSFCLLRRANPKTPPMGNLPEERLGAFQRPFSNCGLDYFGPMTVTIGRRHEKRWGALFTCLTTRAVHLELAASLSTDSAIMAIRRMAARRGWPATIYSDNGTNFKGADAELRQAYAEWSPALQQLGLRHRMQWKYTPPGAPSQGGAWERLVRSVKVALLATLNEKSPKEEVLHTLMTEAEYSINARPLTHVSVERNDPEALTPNHFLIGSSTGQPHTGPCEPTDKRTWRAAQALADEFWRRWVREYLPTLIPRRGTPQDQRVLTEGDLVIVVDHALPRNTWPRGIVERVYPGPDGHVRSADVRTRSGVFRRPTTKLAVLQEAPTPEPRSLSPDEAT